jgi:hypothetical protein
MLRAFDEQDALADGSVEARREAADLRYETVSLDPMRA